jgi:hypothetical protein
MKFRLGLDAAELPSPPLCVGPALVVAGPAARRRVRTFWRRPGAGSGGDDAPSLVHPQEKYPTTGDGMRAERAPGVAGVNTVCALPTQLPPNTFGNVP